MGYSFINENDIALDDDISLGTSLTFRPGQGAFTQIRLTEQQALENLKHLLLTRKGEIYENPDFGSDLLLLLFEHATENIKEEVDDVINEAVNKYLRYIQIINITTTIDANANKITINISFSVSSSGIPIGLNISIDEEGITTSGASTND